MEPIYADFSVSPARLGNAAVGQEGCATSPSHLMIDAGGWVELSFAADGPGDTQQAVATVTALVSKLGPRLGSAPIDVLINGVPLVEGHVMPGGDLPVDTALAVPGARLVAGTNVLRIQTSAESTTRLWLYRITVEAVEKRGGAAIALRREAARSGSVVAYRAERLPQGTDSWREAPRVLVHIDRGEYAELTRLSWRGGDGAEAAVSFQSSMSSFHGHHRSADGTVSEFRGRRVESWTAPEQVAPAAAHVFTTREGWGGGWHDSGELKLLLDDGGADVERVSWGDGAGNSGSVELNLPVPGQQGADEITGKVARVLASGENPGSGEVAVNLIDGSVYSKWLTFAGTARLGFTLDHPAAVGHYELTSANDFEVRDPRDWTLSGSPDGQMWTVLDARSGEAFASRHLSRVFRVRRADQAPYRHYRLEISHSAGHARQLQLARIRFFRPAVAPAAGFLGYYQRTGEGPIGYRGTSRTPAISSVGKIAATPARPGSLARRGTPLTPARPAVRAVPAKPASAPAKSASVPVKPASATAKSAFAPAKPSSAPASASSPAATVPAPAPPVPQDPAIPFDAPLTTVEGWQAYLTDYGADVVRTMGEKGRGEFTQEQLSRGWLGGNPVEESRIVALEERLGTRLPATYRAFVGASDGWRDIGEFMYAMRGVGEIDWFREADPQMCDIFDDDEELGPMLRRSLLISKEGDAQYWFLDSEDVSADGEWAAYTWSSWGFLSERFSSFAALVADERKSMEMLRGYRGVPMHPEGAEELLAEGREQALRGEVEAALHTLERATIKGSGAAAYLKVILGLFLNSEHGHHVLRNRVFGTPHVMAAVGLEQLRAEALPLFLHLTDRDPHSNGPGPYITLLEDVVPLLPSELAELSRTQGAVDPDEEAARRLFDTERSRAQLPTPELKALREKLIRRVEGFTPPVLPEPPTFQSALDEARTLVRGADPDRAWAVIEAALPTWHSESSTRVAPVVLLIDPILNTLITPARSRQIIRTPRGAGR